jgi:hypothetical protein
MKRMTAVVLAVLGISATQAAQEKPSMVWAKTWADAVAEATVRNVPIYLTIHKDG